MPTEKKCCSYCGKENFEDSVFCGYCGNAFPSPSLPGPMPAVPSPKAVEETTATDEKHISQNEENKATCPECGSVSLVCNKKGYSFTKGIIGSIFFGKLGLLAGTIGSRRTEITCIKCGYKFEL